ncbi:MAG: ribonuclease P protein component [Aquificae bacterium]|nr:ribonuclease P protein component [Aquificota bacterium]
METLKGKEIKNILSQPLPKVKTKTFIAIFKGNNLGFPRFAFIVSKKLSKKAVERNRAKRLLKEAIRKEYQFFENLSFDIVFIGRKFILNSKLQDVLKDIETFLKTLREKDEKIFNKSD